MKILNNDEALKAIVRANPASYYGENPTWLGNSSLHAVLMPAGMTSELKSDLEAEGAVFQDFPKYSAPELDPVVYASAFGRSV